MCDRPAAGQERGRRRGSEALQAPSPCLAPTEINGVLLKCMFSPGCSPPPTPPTHAVLDLGSRQGGAGGTEPCHNEQGEKSVALRPRRCHTATPPPGVWGSPARWPVAGHLRALSSSFAGDPGSEAKRAALGGRSPSVCCRCTLLDPEVTRPRVPPDTELVRWTESEYPFDVGSVIQPS